MHDMTAQLTLHLHPPFQLVTALLCVSALLLPPHAKAQDNATPPVSEWVPYVVHQPHKISQLLDVLTLPNNPALALQTLQQHNQAVDLNQLQAGQTIRLPKNWLRQEPAPLKVTRIRCTGKAEPSTAGQQGLYPGMSLGEGDIINVPGGCQVSLSLRDGSQLQLPSSSVVKIDTLRDSPDQKMPQVKLKLLQGKISLNLFKKRPADANFEVATPRATTGVRGTEFRVSHNPDSDTSTIEVLQGQVHAHADNTPQDETISANQGAVIGAQGPIQMHALPQPPELGLQGQVWQWQNLQAATRYVRQDLQAINDIAVWDMPQATPGADIPTHSAGLPDALSTRYIQAAAISPSGLMGTSATFAICPSVGSLPVPVCPVRFQIDETGERATRVDLRERHADASANWVTARPRNPRIREVIALLAPGQYEWQMQGIRTEEGASPLAERTTARGHFTLLSTATASARP
jgi:hypothetical protein